MVLSGASRSKQIPSIFKSQTFYNAPPAHNKNTKMKLLKISLLIGSLATLSNAATITVSAGFGAQGIAVSYNGTDPVTSFLVAVGSYSGGIFTSFGSVIDSGKVSGVITSTAPTSLNSQVIHLFVGNGPTVANSSAWVILTPNVGTTFPSDVTQATGVTYAATVGTNQTLVAASILSWAPQGQLGSLTGGNGLIYIPVPEPSSALLGAIGALTLLRRRRIFEHF
jgi:hypothetical protein